MGKIAYLFPGQGSQQVGMGKELAETNEAVMSLFKRADEVLKENLSSVIFEGPQEKLTMTVNAQPALVTTSIAILEYFKQSGIEADYTAGHSLGEYTALVAAGAFTFEEGIHAVRRRGELMEQAVPNGAGTMAAVLGLNRKELSTVCVAVTAKGDSVQLANLNCPGQIVISGSKKGVKEASFKAKEAGAKRVLPLNVSGPFHSELMKPAAAEFSNVLDSIGIVESRIPVIANVSAEPMQNAAEIKDKLIKQLYSPVLWEDSIVKMIEFGVDTFIEIGPGKVLSGLVKKINRNVKTYAVDDQASCDSVIAALREEN